MCFAPKGRRATVTLFRGVKLKIERRRGGRMGENEFFRKYIKIKKIIKKKNHIVVRDSRDPRG